MSDRDRQEAVARDALLSTVKQCFKFCWSHSRIEAPLRLPRPASEHFPAPIEWTTPPLKPEEPHFRLAFSGGTVRCMDEEIVVDVSDRVIQDLAELWPVLIEECRLPDWFGRNPDAWRDALVSGGVSPFLDSRRLVLIVRAAGVFEPGSEAEKWFKDDFEEASHHAELRIIS